MLLKKLCELGTIATSKYIINVRLLISLPPLMSPNLLVWSLRLSSGWCMVAHLVIGTVIFNKFNIFVNWSLVNFMYGNLQLTLVTLIKIILSNVASKPGVANNHLNAPLSSRYQLHLIRSMQSKCKANENWSGWSIIRQGSTAILSKEFPHF